MIDIKEDLFDCVENKQECNVYSKPIIQKYKKYIDNIETEPKEDNENYRFALKIKINLNEFKKINKEKQYYSKENDTIVFILMNTSYASKTESDKTINNCIEIAGYNNYSNIEIYNLSPFRTPDPECLNKKLKLECPGIANKTEKEKQEIKKIINDLNEQNKKKLEEVANSNNKTIVVAWGVIEDKDEVLKTNANYFLEMCKKNGKYKDIKCIAKNTTDNSPRHPGQQSKNNYKEEEHQNIQWEELINFNDNQTN